MPTENSPATGAWPNHFIPPGFCFLIGKARILLLTIARSEPKSSTPSTHGVSALIPNISPSHRQSILRCLFQILAFLTLM